MWRRGKDRSTAPFDGVTDRRTLSTIIERDATAISTVPSISGFLDLTVIGHGSTATVYRATQDGFDREVAVKVLHLDISDRRAQKRFQRERSLNGRLSNHPNVVTVLDSGFVDGRHPYLVMEYLEEGSLADRLKQRGPFDLGLTMHIGVRIAGALESAHRVGVLHRDVKPNNILLSRLEEPALADFGIAAILELEQSYTAALTPVHAAPELLEGSEPTPQTDVYALGSTLYTLLAGAAPFAGPAGEGMLSQLLRITTSDVPSLARDDTPRELLDLLRDSLAKRPESRIPSAVEFGERLQALQHQFGLPLSVLPVEGPLKATTNLASNNLLGPDHLTQTIEPLKVIEPIKLIEPVKVTPTPVVSIAKPTPPTTRPSSTTPTAPEVAVATTATVTFQNPPVVSHATFDPDLTISARQLHPPQPVEAQRKRPWWVLPVVVGCSLGTVAIVAVLALTSDTSSNSVATTVALATPSTPSIVDDSGYTPTNVLVAAQDGAISVRFGDRTNGQRQHLIKITRGPGKDVLDPVVTQVGDSYLVLPPVLDATEPICVVVSAVIELPSRFAESAPVCLNGGKIG